MTDTELEALAVRMSRGHDYLSGLEYEGQEFRRVFPTYEQLCDSFRAEMEHRNFFE